MNTPQNRGNAQNLFKQGQTSPKALNKRQKRLTRGKSPRQEAKSPRLKGKRHILNP
ncbi:uncharacterized protein G2W53_029322 [Senna tora]|uniref:Uncharacterized protein n=1 Tax=Senna tora TaxID=362788 RepID=A0A834T567_9FABA|nr:uncharacterized protein G2W53_029322 [Senna tora]